MDQTRTKSRLIVEMRDHLVSTEWIIVDVNMRHNQLATLYPTSGKGHSSRNKESFEIAEDILRRLIAEKRGELRD
jgi:hypothetical protein